MQPLRYLAIRRENKSVWERRVPLSPSQVHSLLLQNPALRIIIQPSALRVFSDHEYQIAGAMVQEDIDIAQVVIGVKEIPIEYLQKGKTYMQKIKNFQKANMKALDHILQNNIRLIDYEKICDSEGKRLVAFGRFAGLAGMIDFLSGLGIFLFQRQIPTTFINVDMSYKYYNLQEAFIDLQKAGENLKKEKILKDICPLIFGVTGAKGRVGQGAIEILNFFPCKYVTFEEIEVMFQDKENTDHSDHIYIVEIDAQHMVQHKQNQAFNKRDYYSNPSDYEPIFHQKYLKYISVIVNCMYWDMKFPRLITDQQIQQLQSENCSRLIGVCEITCDFLGSIEFLKKFTDCDCPYYTYFPSTLSLTDGCHGQLPSGILYHSMDFLPCELAYDSSQHFGEQLCQFIPNLVFRQFMEYCSEGDELCQELRNAVITENGELAKNFRYINLLRMAQEKESSIKESQQNQEGLVEKTMKRKPSFLSLMIRGQLLSTDAFKKLCHLLQEYNVQFNFADWQIKHQMDEQYVCLQIMSSLSKNFNFLEEIKDVLDEFDVEILQNI